MDAVKMRNESKSVHDFHTSLQKFGWPDHLVFYAMLVISATVGIYFAYWDHHKRKNVTESRRGSMVQNYLVGGRKMPIFPVSMSLVASWMSGISLLGTSTEIYLYGISFMYTILPAYIMGFVTYHVYLPVFHDLGITTIYEYLEQRFDNRIRIFGSVIFIIKSTVFLPIAIYVPALAFNQVTGVNLYVITPIVCLVCIFYTSLGGLKAVVWTDVIQIFIMIGSLFLIMIKGTYDVGGLSVVWQKNYDSGRITWPSFSLDPTVRHSFWSLIIGGSFFWCHTTPVNQSLIQRFLALPTLRSAQKALIIYVIGVNTLLVMVSYNGFLLYAAYYDCDPITTKLAKKKDQMIPIFVMDILGNFPGIPGIFIAGVFSAALSTLSTVLNALSAIVLQDFVKPFVKGPVSFKLSDYVMRGTVIVFGIIAFGLVFIVEKLGTVLQLAISFGSLSLGPMLGIFTMGMFMPWINATSALIGGVSGMISSAYIVLRAQADIATGKLRFQEMSVSVEGCTYQFANVTKPAFDFDQIDKSLHHISYLYYTMAGTLVACAVGCIASFIVGHNNMKDMNQKLVAPFLRNFYFDNIENVDKDEKDEEIVHKFEIKDNKL